MVSSGRQIEGDALEVMRGMADAFVSLIVADKPYFEVKGDAWDNQWKDAAEFLAWVNELCIEWKRILKPNGSLYVFASPQMARRVGNVIAEHFNILTDIRWAKPEYSTKAEMFRKEDLRAPFPSSETIWFAEQYSTLPAMIEAARLASGLSRQEVSQYIVGTKSGACWNWEAGIRFPERGHWEKLRELFPSLPAFDEVERPFNASPDAPYTDVWTFPTVGYYEGKHPCEKPLALMEHIINLSSRSGDVVLDCFSGSGTTGEAAINLGREFIGIDSDPHWCEVSRARMSNASGVLVRMPKRKAVTDRPLPLLDCGNVA